MADSKYLPKMSFITIKKTVTKIFSSLIIFAAMGIQASTCEAVQVKKVVFGMDIYPPYVLMNEQGQLTGIDCELAEEAGRRMGFKPEFRIIDWAKKKELLQSGEIDGIWSCFTMSGRENDFTWAGPYLGSSHSIIVKNDSDIYKLSDLNGRSLCVQSTTVPARIFEGGYKVKKTLPVLSELVMFSSTEDCLAALRQQGCDAVAAHEEALQSTVDGGGYRFLDEPLETVGIGVAFRGDSSYFADSLTKTFEQMRKDGFIKKVVEKYHLRYHEPPELSQRAE